MDKNTSQIIPYPLNVMREMNARYIRSKDEAFPDKELTPDQLRGVEYAMKKLPPRHREMFLKRFKDHETVTEIGKVYGISDSYVSAIIERCMRILRVYRKFMVEGYGQTVKDRYLAHKENTGKLGRDALSLEVICLKEMAVEPTEKWALREGGIITLGDLVKAFECETWHDCFPKLSARGAKGIAKFLIYYGLVEEDSPGCRVLDL